MRRILVLLTIGTASVFAANVRLYLRDGTSELVREYKVEEDRVKFYSVERGDWEEVPLTLIDLKRTEAEATSKRDSIERQARQISEEDAAARELQKEILKIPQDPGVYMLENDQLRIFKLADAYVHNNKGRSILKSISPIPLIPGKATLEIPEPHAVLIVKESRPELYLQTALNGAQFGIVKVTPKGMVRIVENIVIEPVVKEVAEQRELVPSFSKQLTESGLFKVWPQEPMAKGEYAVIEYTEGRMDARIWDFRIE